MENEAATSERERKVLAERFTFNDFYFYGGFLALVGAALSAWLLADGSWAMALTGLIALVPGLFLISVPLRQIGLPIALIVMTDGRFIVTDVKRRTFTLRAEDVIECNASRKLHNGGVSYRPPHRRALNAGYVYLTTAPYGKLKIGYVHAPFEKLITLQECFLQAKKNARP